MDNGDRMSTALTVIGELPIFPEHYRILMDLVADPEVDLGRVCSTIERDIGLATMVLRAANSPYYGGNGKIRTIRSAVARIGLKSLSGYILSAALRMFVREGDAVSRMVWRHLSACGECCRWLARTYTAVDPDEAYVLGLMHDIGWLVMHFRVPDMLARLIRDHAVMDVPWNLEDVESVELNLYGLTHAELGCVVCERWRLNGDLSRSIRGHHQPGDERTRLVWLADRFCRLLWEGSVEEDQEHWSSVCGINTEEAYLAWRDLSVWE